MTDANGDPNSRGYARTIVLLCFPHRSLTRRTPPVDLAGSTSSGDPNDRDALILLLLEDNWHQNQRIQEQNQMTQKQNKTIEEQNETIKVQNQTINRQNRGIKKQYQEIEALSQKIERQNERIEELNRTIEQKNQKLELENTIQHPKEDGNNKDLLIFCGAALGAFMVGAITVAILSGRLPCPPKGLPRMMIGPSKK